MYSKYCPTLYSPITLMINLYSPFLFKFVFLGSIVNEGEQGNNAAEDATDKENRVKIQNATLPFLELLQKLLLNPPPVCQLSVVFFARTCQILKNLLFSCYSAETTRQNYSWTVDKPVRKYPTPRSQIARRTSVH